MPRLQPGGQADHRDAGLARRGAERAARRRRVVAACPYRLRRLEACERLLGVAGVAGPEDRAVPPTSRAATRSRGRSSSAARRVAERRPREQAADRRAAHAADDQPPCYLASRPADSTRQSASRRCPRGGRGRRRAVRSGRPRGSAASVSLISPAPAPRRPRPARPGPPPAARRRPRSARRARSPRPARSSPRPPTPTSAARIDPRTSARAPTRQPSSSTEVSISAPEPTLEPGTQHRARRDPRVGRQLGAVSHERPAVAGELGLDRPLEDVPARLQVALGGADVHPVALQPAPVEPVADEARKDLPLDRDRPSGRDQIQHRALEHVGAGADLVGVDLLRSGFSRNPAISPVLPRRTSP